MVLGIIFLAGLTAALWWYYSLVRRYPPGPTPIPFIGNMLQVNFGSKPFWRFAKQFDGIYTIFAPFPLIELTDFNLIKEAYIEKGEDFVNRLSAPGADDIFNYIPNGGVIQSSGEEWRENRRAALHILRDFGMGKNVMEELAKNSITEYLHHLESIENKDEVNMRWPLLLMIANIINEVLFGYRYKYDDCEELKQYVTDFCSVLSEIAKAKLLPLGLALPAIRHVPILGYHALIVHKERFQKINAYVERHVKETMKSYDADAQPTTFVHAYAEKMKTNAILTEDQLIATSADFYFAGMETTSNTLRWALLYLAKYQDVQDKLRSEIDAVIGKDRLPSLADKPKMIYGQACIAELQRCANVLRINLIRVARREVTIGGHTIQKGAAVHADIHYVLANDPLFVDPAEFRPERYIAEDGMSLRKDLLEHSIVFSLGKRACAGEGLARVELFLCLLATIQYYRVLPTDEPIDLEPIPQNFSVPKEQNLRLVRV
ncbi:hypothetical protein PMAYCL1PPCAC_16208 [Pristionchus mayeri]|uniref:Cytochrome P450 n=1 Tax=Pristionchus mayeri TaxID=1317129 RepID=A0AAN5CKF6_9BILA|nr:hypothetical protein PMAYCL1PPCAC_16208 [Pristionchus mayeri]